MKDRDQLIVEAKEMVSYEYTESEKVQLKRELDKLYDRLKGRADQYTLKDLFEIMGMVQI